MIKTGLLIAERSLPLVIEPEDYSPEKRSLSSLVEWLKNNRRAYESWLLKHGALLFRGFPINTPEEFEVITRAISPELLNYVEGNSPRKQVSGKVYTSTEYPEQYKISLHNELSYAHSWPHKIFFFCAVAPQHQGETPIVDCREVLKMLGAQVQERFENKKVKYVHNLHGGSGIGKSWQETFETTERAKVEEYLRAGEVEFRWRDDGGLWTSQTREAVAIHPETGERVWFNQAEQWHPSMLDQKNRKALEALGMKEEDLPHNAFYGDGTALDSEELERIRTLMRERAVFFKWMKSDLLVLDNMLVAHGRNSYKGPRQILVAMA
jgi:alpha-ketoglutarate-dependent taurine dioxygenase